VICVHDEDDFSVEGEHESLQDSLSLLENTNLKYRLKVPTKNAKNTKNVFSPNEILIEGLPDPTEKASDIIDILQRENNSCGTVYLKASGEDMCSVVEVAELVKLNMRGEVHQITELDVEDVEEVWEPLEEGLEIVKTSKRVCCLTITLSTLPLDTNHPNYQYQPPMSKEELETAEAEEAKKRAVEEYIQIAAETYSQQEYIQAVAEVEKNIVSSEDESCSDWDAGIFMPLLSDDDEHLKYLRVETPQNGLIVENALPTDVIVTALSQTDEIVADVFELLEHEDTIRLKAIGEDISNLVLICESIKWEIDSLHQLNEIDSKEVEEIWEPLEEGLRVVKNKKVVCCMTITLSKKDEFLSHPCYQAPLSLDDINEAQVAAEADEERRAAEIEEALHKGSQKAAADIYFRVAAEAYQENQEKEGEKKIAGFGDYEDFYDQDDEENENENRIWEEEVAPKYVKIDNTLDTEIENLEESPTDFVITGAVGNQDQIIAEAMRLFLSDTGTKTIRLKAIDSDISNVVLISELIKQQVDGLHQLIELYTKEVEEVWEPLEEGLKMVKTQKLVCFMTITLSLSTELLDTSQPGYQPPEKISEKARQENLQTERQAEEDYVKALAGVYVQQAQQTPLHASAKNGVQQNLKSCIEMIKKMMDDNQKSCDRVAASIQHQKQALLDFQSKYPVSGQEGHGADYKI